MKSVEITWCALSDSSPYYIQHVAQYARKDGGIEEFEQIKNVVPYETEEEFFKRVETHARAHYEDDIEITWEYNAYLGGCPL